MSQINVGGVVKGGLAAGVVMNLSEFVLNVPVAGEQMNAELAARNLPDVTTTRSTALSIVDLLKHETVVLTEAAAGRVAEVLAP